jgi:hypothetical protein
MAASPLFALAQQSRDRAETTPALSTVAIWIVAVTGAARTSYLTTSVEFIAPWPGTRQINE